MVRKTTSFRRGRILVQRLIQYRAVLGNAFGNIPVLGSVTIKYP